MSFVSAPESFRTLAKTEAAPVAGRCTVVVPCYNEAERLDPEAFLSALRTQEKVDFLFVNDGSKDDTLKVLNALADRAPGRIAVFDMPANGGKAEAVRQGLRVALERGAGYVAYWDADLATPLYAIDDMARVLDRLASVEVVFGSRRRLMGHAIRRDKSRRMVSRICNLMARTALGMPVGDTQCGAKMFRASPALAHAVETPFRAGWLFDIEMFSRLSRGAGVSAEAFYELPLIEWSEIAGSKISSRAVLRSGLQMLRLIAQNRGGDLIARTSLF